MSRTLKLEANIFSKYLIGEIPSKDAVELYQKSITANQKELGLSDKKLLAFARRYPVSLGFLDAGLVFINPYSELRRRLYVMFSILEANPSYTDKFLPKKRSAFYILLVGLVGLRAILRAIVGVIVVKVVAR